MRARIDRSRARSVLTAAAALLATTSASAATLTVSDGSAPCPGASFTTIQSAVDAADPRDTITVCPGTYVEQVTVPASKHGLVLRSSELLAAVIKAPAVMADPGDIVHVQGAHDVTLEGFTISGPLPDALFCSVLPRSGVRVDGGGSALLQRDHVTEIRSADPSLRGCQSGIGVLVGSHAEGQTGTATVFRNTIDAYQKNGIVVDSPGSTAFIVDNLVTGDGPTATIAQNGVVIRNGADALVASNRVTGQVYSPSPLSAGLLFYLPGHVTVVGNYVYSADYGILTVDAVGAQILNNTVVGCVANGIDLDQLTTGTTGSFVLANYSNQNGQDGIFVSALSSGNNLRHNWLLGNSELDARDDSTGHRTADTANAWHRNHCRTDNHGGLLCDGDGHADAEDESR